MTSGLILLGAAALVPLQDERVGEWTVKEGEEFKFSFVSAIQVDRKREGLIASTFSMRLEIEISGILKVTTVGKDGTLEGVVALHSLKGKTVLDKKETRFSHSRKELAGIQAPFKLDTRKALTPSIDWEAISRFSKPAALAWHFEHFVPGAADRDRERRASVGVAVRPAVGRCLARQPGAFQFVPWQHGRQGDASTRERGEGAQRNLEEPSVCPAAVCHRERFRRDRQGGAGPEAGVSAVVRAES